MSVLKTHLSNIYNSDKIYNSWIPVTETVIGKIGIYEKAIKTALEHIAGYISCTWISLNWKFLKKH